MDKSLTGFAWLERFYVQSNFATSFFLYLKMFTCELAIFRILEILRMSSLSTEFKSHMVEIVDETMSYREKHNVSRKDFIQLLMELRKTGKVSGDDEAEKSEQTTASGKVFMTMEQCAAQVALFYLAGFDTTASAIAYCLFELSRNPELMQRLHTEIDDVLERHNNVISYDTINEMTFLEYCVLGKRTVVC